MNVGDYVRVTDAALSLWADDETLLTPALLVHIGSPNRFLVKDITEDGTGQYLVLPCCRAFKHKGVEICHAHLVEFFAPCENDNHDSVPMNDGPAPEKSSDDSGAGPAADADHDAETSVSLPVVGKILKLGYTRENGGRLSLRVPGLDEFELTGGLSKLAAKLLRGEGVL